MSHVIKAFLRVIYPRICNKIEENMNDTPLGDMGSLHWHKINIYWEIIFGWIQYTSILTPIEYKFTISNMCIDDTDLITDY